MSQPKTYDYEIRFYGGIDVIHELFASKPGDDPRFMQVLVEALPRLMQQEIPCMICGCELGTPLMVVVVLPARGRHDEGRNNAVASGLCAKCCSQPPGKICEDVTDIIGRLGRADADGQMKVRPA